MNNGAEKPNILIVTTDQQRADSLSCYGSDFTSTPHIDRLASEGVRFDRAYCPNPVCTPSRVSLFTGKAVSRHGAWNVGVHAREDERMLSHLLAAEGYQTHYIGKAHFQSFGSADPPSQERTGRWANGYEGWNGPYYGFETVELALGHATYGISGHYGEWVRRHAQPDDLDRWRRAKNLHDIGFGGNAFDWEMPLEFHNSVWTANRAEAFLKERDASRPFFLAVGFQDPHHPHAVPVEQTDRVDPADVPPPDYTEGELEDKPPHFLAAREGRLEKSKARGRFSVAGQGAGCDYRRVTEQDARLGRAYYYSMVKLIDAQFGRIVNALDEMKLANDTLILFTSDHGELLGDHGLWMKGPFHYEPLARVPFIVRWPARVPGGRSCGDLVNLIDAAPTCLSALDMAPPSDMDGIDLLPTLAGEDEGEDEHQRSSTIIEMTDDPNALRLKTLITQNRKLTRYAGQTYGELYDLENDPREKINRWNDPNYADEKAALLNELMDAYEPLERRGARHCYA